MNANYFVPGAVANMNNRNTEYKGLFSRYNLALLLLIIPGGILTALNFGNAGITLYQYYMKFDAGFHEASPLWAYITSRILGITPILLIILSKSLEDFFNFLGGPNFVNNATENLILMLNSDKSAEHFPFVKVVTYRLFISLIVFMVSIIVQYMVSLDIPYFYIAGTWSFHQYLRSNFLPHLWNFPDNYALSRTKESKETHR